MADIPKDKMEPPAQTAQPSQPILQWNGLAVAAIKLVKWPSPMAARALAMVHTAMYDAWSVYNKCACSTTTALYIKRYKNNAPGDMPKACSYAAYRVLTHMFWLHLPTDQRGMFREQMCRLGYDADDCSVDCCSPSGIGNLVARLVIEQRRGDGANEAGLPFHYPPWSDYTCYRPLNPPYPARARDLSLWQPLTLRNKAQEFILPHWPLVRPFALRTPRQFRPAPPFTFSDQPFEFKKQVQEILHFSANLGDREKVIAEYWSGHPGTATIPGQWCQVAQLIAETRSYDDTRSIQLFFALANALLDVSIACWESKRKYDAARPITIVRELYRSKTIRAWGGPGKGTVEMDGKDWFPYQLPPLPTPASPEHVSEQSSYSYAAAAILQYFTGSDEFCGYQLVKKAESSIEPGITPAEDLKLEWPRFTDAAEEAAMAGLYGGIQFRRSIELGKKLGEAVAAQVYEKALQLFND